MPAVDAVVVGAGNRGRFVFGGYALANPDRLRIAALAEPRAIEEAERHYTEGLALARELGLRPLEARCHLSLGQLYRRAGQCDQACEQLTVAITMLSDMDMTYWLEQAEAQLKDLG